MNHTFGKRFLSLALSTVMCLGGTTAINALAYDDTSATSNAVVPQAILTLKEVISAEDIGFKLTVTYGYYDGQDKIAGINKIEKTYVPKGYTITNITYERKDYGDWYYFYITYRNPQGVVGVDRSKLWA